MLLCDSSWYKWWHASMMNKFECMILKIPPGLNELRALSGKALFVQILLTLTEGIFYWFYNGYLLLKFKHVGLIAGLNMNCLYQVIMNKSHLPFQGFIVNKPWRLFPIFWFFFSKINRPVSGHRLYTSLVNPPQSLAPRAPGALPPCVGMSVSFCSPPCVSDIYCTATGFCGCKLINHWICLSV